MNRSRTRFPVILWIAASLFYPLAPLTAAGAPAPLPDPEPESHRWNIHPQYALPGRAGGFAPGPAGGHLEISRPVNASGFAGLRATHRVCLRAPEALSAADKGEFSVGLWLSDHVNRPVAVKLRPLDGQTVWSVGYVDGRVTVHLPQTGKETVIQTGGDSPFRRHKSHWMHILFSVSREGWNLYLNGEPAAFGNEAVPCGDAFELLTYLEKEIPMHPGNLVRQVFFHDYSMDSVRARERFNGLASLLDKGQLEQKALSLIAGPYLHYPRQDSVNLTWEFNRPVESRLRVATSVEESGESGGSVLDKWFPADGGVHVAEIDGLDPDTRYFYRIDAVEGEGDSLSTGWLSFQTAVKEEQPFVFAVLGDTEARPHINEAIGRRIWGERPHFLLVLGDLTDGGFEDDKHQWNLEYFHGISPLAGRIPVVAVPGNGDSDLFWFNRYHKFPEPGNRYRFRYGPAEFFMLDSNQSAAPGTAQGEWLEKVLENSDAQWKILAFHHPTYTSDENDYGDTYRGNVGEGDRDIRPALPIMEEHGVDLCLFGHLHTYERSWPVKNGRIDLDEGILHVQSGGGGGNLEDFAPTRNWHSAKTYRGYHYIIFEVSKRAVSARVYALDGRLIDMFTIN